VRTSANDFGAAAAAVASPSERPEGIFVLVLVSVTVSPLLRRNHRNSDEKRVAASAPPSSHSTARERVELRGHATLRRNEWFVEEKERRRRK
jgi:hypothetical protein